MENWLGSSLNQIHGWTTVRESYCRALEQGPLLPCSPFPASTWQFFSSTWPFLLPSFLPSSTILVLVAKSPSSLTLTQGRAVGDIFSSSVYDAIWPVSWILVIPWSVDLWVRKCLKCCGFLLRRHAYFPSPSVHHAIPDSQKYPHLSRSGEVHSSWLLEMVGLAWLQLFCISPVK